MRTFVVIAIIVVVLALALAGCSTSGAQRNTQLGGDVDSYGCRMSAGYSWSEQHQACVRPWEQNNS